MNTHAALDSQLDRLVDEIDTTDGVELDSPDLLADSEPYDHLDLGINSKNLKSESEEIQTFSANSHYKPGVTSDTEERALELLGSGIQPEQVAAALGVTPSRIAQLLGDDNFSKQVSHIRYEALQGHNVRDSKYDNLEDKILDQLTKSVSLIFKPTELAKVLQTVNSAKRRGQSAPQQVVNQQNIISLIMPNVVITKFKTNVNNQVIRAGEQELLTMTSNNLLDKHETRIDSRLIEQNLAEDLPEDLMENDDVQEEGG